MSKEILSSVSNYYSDKIKKHGATNLGVDWNGKESQYLRFEQLSKVISLDDFSILDYGCGYGEYINYLKERQLQFSYTGVDISKEMIERAKTQHPDFSEHFYQETDQLPAVNYSIASGLFNVKNEFKDEEWLNYIKSELIKLDACSSYGFSFNALTLYSDKEYMKDYLYYADPLHLFDFCKKNFSRNVALLHDYELYEFTILVKKN
jgi:SAM-dependent methyltransferase